jgi:transposase
MIRGRPRKPSPLDGQEEFITTHTRREIIRKFGVDYNHVNNYCIRNNLKPLRERRQIDIILSDEILEYAKTHTCSEISSKFDIPYNNLRYVFLKHGIKFYRNKGRISKGNNSTCKRTGEAHEMIRELSKTFTMASIARVFGYSKERVRQICAEIPDDEK